MATFEPFDDGQTFTEDDWKEALATWKPGGGDTLTNKGSSASLSVLIPAAKARAAHSWCLGYSFADDAPPWLLHRSTPVSHPRWGTQLRCTGVDFQFFSPKGNDANPGNEPYETTVVGTAGISRYGNYEQCLMTVHFGPKNFLMFEDSDPEWSGFEYDRFTTRYQIEPQLDIVSADNGRVLTWQEGPAGVIGEEFPGNLGERLSQTVYYLTWHEVPKSYVTDSVGRPLKIEAAVGRVNLTDFLGFPAGTLLLQAPKFELHMFPFYSADGRPLYFDITFPLIYFDPPPGSSSPLARGHNLMPHRSGGADGGPAWFLATRDDASSISSGPSGPRYLEETEFSAMFTNVNS